jgi:predicted alpha/beta-hydrolase family hydrolase
MSHSFLQAVASDLADRGIATLRYNFPFMERRSKRPDPPSLAHAAVRAAVSAASRMVPELPLIAGGKSFGGRMTSQAQASSPLPGVRGLAFLGFPLHSAKQPSDQRAAHLSSVSVPMLFLQGTRDELANLDHLRRVCERLKQRATLVEVLDADHSFHVPARSGRNDGEVRAEIFDALAAWTTDLVAASAARRSHSRGERTL